MIEKALRYINSLRDTKILEINGRKFADGDIDEINNELLASSIQTTTLQSLIQYIKENPDQLERQIIHVESPTKVTMMSLLNSDRNRESCISVIADISHFPFDQFLDNEMFNIKMQAMFCNEYDRPEVLAFAGNIEAGTTAKYGDDGISQKATIKTGITQMEDKMIPNPVYLTPVRTFTEVEQPSSNFIFRVKDNGERGIQCALFEADGGAWKKEAMDNIRQYLDKQLDGCNVLVIS